ncbi:MAG: ABC transporter permease [Acidimicrobiia bacterium]
MRTNRFRRLLQVGAFMRKETVDILRQPRLLLTLVLGPFLIMAIFGLGYRDTPEPLRTAFVAPEGSPFLDQIEQYADDLDSYVQIDDVGTEGAAARQRLVDGEIDLIVTFPDDPLGTVLAGERAPITVVHTRLDPIEQTAINFAARLAVDQINGQILARVVGEGQTLVEPAGGVIDAASTAVAAWSSAIEAGDAAAAEAALDDLDAAVGQLGFSVQTSAQLTRQLTGIDAVDEPSAAVSDTLASLRSTVEDLRGGTTTATDGARAEQLNDLLTTLSGQYEQFTSVDPQVLVQPFESDVGLAVDDVNRVTDWYAPAAVILMLQQFGIAFGALTFVRERQLGIVDVFRVAPVHASETLIGKYLAFLAIGGAIGALLTTLVVTTLDVPIAGTLGQIAIVMALSLFAAIGLGFVISLASASDAQAVQYTMIILLASLFFSGFFLSIGQMEGLAQVISWLLPVSYGMKLLRDVMLRGTDLDLWYVGGLAAFGVVMFVLALAGTRRRMSTAQ